MSISLARAKTAVRVVIEVAGRVVENKAVVAVPVDIKL